MHNDKMEFSLILADNALRHHFTIRHNTYLDFLELNKNCRDFMEATNTRRLYAKLMKMELNRQAVEGACRSLAPEKQKYLHLRYREEKSVIAISLALHVSVAQLNLWHRNILEQVSRFMLYKLRPDDVFNPDKISGMVKLLSDARDFVSWFDPEGVVITADWLSAIATRHTKYKLLQNAMENILQKEVKSLHELIVATRLSNPHETTSFIAQNCHVDGSVVSRHLHDFGNDMAKYLK